MGVFTRERQPEKAKPYSTHRTLTAAAQKLPMNDKSSIEQLKKRRANAKWQDDAWEYYDAIGEIKYAFRLFTNVLSRIRLYGAFVEDDDKAPSPIKESDLPDDVKLLVQRVMRNAFSSAQQSEILRKAGVNLLVVGECYLVKLPAKYGVRDVDQWRIISIDELHTESGRYYLKTEETQRRAIDMEELPSGTFIGRIWNQHARYSDQPDSSMKALVDLCDELFLFSRAARATARSRLNAGAMFVPDTLSVSSDSVTEVSMENGEVDPTLPIIEEIEDDDFEQELMDAMTTPIADEGSASSVVPLLIRGPRDDGAAIKLFKFERSFDPQLSLRAERALERILQGIDLPKDIVTGLANIKYSNAVQIEESLYTAHIEPLVLMLCDAFRTVYLVPALTSAGIAPELIDQIVIWYDPSAIMTAPDKSSAANVGHDKMALSNEAWRKYNGFVDADAPEDLEIAQRIAIQRGQLNDALTEALFKTIMPQVMADARAQSIANSPSPLPGNVQEALGGPKPPDNPADHGPPPVSGDQPPPIVEETSGAQPPPPVPGP